MSWLYSRALVEEFSAAKSSDGKPSAPSKTTPTPLAYCAPDRTTDYCRLSRSGQTFAPLTGNRGPELLTWYLGAFPAPTYPQRERGPGSKARNRDSGPKWPGSLAKYDPEKCLWKTPQCSLLGDLQPFSETWPRWGSMRTGESWARTMPAHLISVTASGFWLATPTEILSSGGSSGMLPTPTAQDYGTNRGGRNRLGPVRPSLSTIAKQWPTPNACAGNNTSALNSGARGRKMLDAVTTPEEKRQIVGGSLNPAWVAWLMGWPIGWTALDASEMAKSPRLWPWHTER